MSASPPLARGRRWLVRAVLVLATLAAVVSIVAVWANRQVLDADNWADTSSELLQDAAIRGQVSTFLVDQLYANVDVTGELADALPERLDPLAGPAANALRNVAEDRTATLLGRPRVQELWQTANRVSAQQFIDIAEGDSRAVTLSGDAVVLDLRFTVTDLVRRLGGSGRLVERVPEDAGRITVMEADEVETVQDGVVALRGLSVVLPLGAIVLFALAVVLAPARRRETLMLAGGGLVIAGLVVLVGRSLAGDHVVDSLAGSASVVPAAEAVWTIGTGMLRDVAGASVVMGIPVIAAAWVAGPSRPATAARRATAPWLRDRPGIAYGGLAALLALVVLWGPIPSTRMLLPVLLMSALAVLGMAVLRRQVAEEFPDRSPDDVTSSLRAAVARVVRTVRPAEPPPLAVPAPVVSAMAPDADGSRPTRVEQLERLAALHDHGVLTDEEFLMEKQRITGPGVAR